MSYSEILINDELLSRYIAGEASAAEVSAIQNWLAGSEANRQHFESLKSAGAQGKVVEPSPAVSPVQPVKPKMKASWWIGLAATILLIAVVAFLTLSHFYDTKKIGFIKVDSKDAVLARVLPDGTYVTMNKNSTIIYPEKFAETRPVSLLGEAFFKVGVNDKPFIVKVNGITVKAVGTASFNVKSREGRTVIDVDTGSVSVGYKNKSTDLNIGQRVRVNAKKGLLQVQTGKDRLYTYYLTHQLVCNNTPLPELVEELNDEFGSHIIIADSSLNTKVVTAVFKDKQLDEILAALAAALNMEITHHQTSIVLKEHNGPF